ncbi:MAG: dTMP kinase [Chloroflexota bacterium]|jgi:dTMP kinase|nr:dTMP kinase [Chloroflexota bacterium]MEE2620661.1 dTMP kinase [Chloroflexota bacterium]
MSFFISIEGFDGTGKTTQASILKKNLDDLNIDSILVREPGSTSFSEKIREILKENTEIETLTELLLFQASRYELVKKVIIPNLETGKVVITDRFSDSSIAYQGYGGGLDIKLIETLNNISTSNLKPDLTFLLDLNLESSKKRTFSRNNDEQIDKFEKKDSLYHKKVKDGFLEILKNNNDRIIKIDASKDIYEISELILNIALEKINEAV